MDTQPTNITPTQCSELAQFMKGKRRVMKYLSSVQRVAAEAGTER